MNTNTNGKAVKMVFLMTDGDKYYKPEVMAFMPEEDYNRDGSMKMCYTHGEQHTPCSEAYALDCKPAKEKQYKPLLEELEKKVGYSVEVLDAATWRRAKRGRRLELRQLDRNNFQVPPRSEGWQEYGEALMREEAKVA